MNRTKSRKKNLKRFGHTVAVCRNFGPGHRERCIDNAICAIHSYTHTNTLKHITGTARHWQTNLFRTNTLFQYGKGERIGGVGCSGTAYQWQNPRGRTQEPSQYRTGLQGGSWEGCSDFWDWRTFNWTLPWSFPVSLHPRHTIIFSPIKTGMIRVPFGSNPFPASADRKY